MTNVTATQTQSEVKGNVKDVYARVVEQIIAKLEAGTIPWEKPWATAQNAVSGRAYRGMNAFILADGQTPYWITFNQVQALRDKQYKAGKGQSTGTGEKISVKKGATSRLVFFWKFFNKVEKVYNNKSGEYEDKARRGFFAKTFRVFNIADCHLPKEFLAKLTEGEVTKQPSAEELISKYTDAPAVHYQGARACYQPQTDEVFVPDISAFKSSGEFYSTLFHELAHSTGAAQRLNRKGVADFDHFGSHQYSKEELIAEFAASFLCSECGITRTIDNSAAYIANWLEKLKEDPRMIVMAASQAQKAADWVTGVKPAKEKKDKENLAA